MLGTCKTWRINIIVRYTYLTKTAVLCLMQPLLYIYIYIEYSLVQLNRSWE